MKYGDVWAPWRGDSLYGNHTEVILEDKEIITGFDTLYGPMVMVHPPYQNDTYFYNVINTITIHTNIRTIGPYGLNDMSHNLQSSHGQYFLYLTGSSAWYLDKITPHYALCNTL